MPDQVKLIVVGDSPSKTNTNKHIAFVGARCYSTVKGWLSFIGVDVEQCVMVNQSDSAFCNKKLLLGLYHNIPVITMGRKAQQFVDNFNSTRPNKLKYFPLPHPSGLNRQLNNKEAIKATLEECKQWLLNV